ncbi:MAG: phage tail tube protein [Bacteroidetes bacterium]|nr:phage tail tube protein [Bacteroidota bacterium]
MATLGTVKGNLVGVYISDGATPAVYSLIACGTNASLNITNDMIETVCKDNDGARSVLPGQQSVSMSIEGLTAFNNVGRTELFGSAKDKTQLTLRYGSGVTGDPYVQVDAYISSFEETAPLNDSTSFSVSFDCSNMTTGTFS